ncbi:MAG TPA: long-chain fatty acid--CoA ligase [Syntrophales bacterium]|jgi:long-chain acyl-CoA synthetase|nr:long-chain fatty acid--CoA ligase [Syntrophales bacterium]HOU78603.1 long-chain fatty acid--CoA ligase [Syntrophales bacterium]HPC33565.1 long-chain fatty acid--CoA ligase [Syntrophales bacterium]HQG35411.1 long-chain fatty acid--CoA ligase [Syntrophales bacterium]HQI35813.1 long-chain fatty acid--CoA ligase [Syntrophales bacterium]
MHTYKLDKPDNLVDLLEESVARYPDNLLFGTKNQQKMYEWITYRDFGRRVDNLRGGLAQLGVTKGDAVGIIANNRVEWAEASFATYGLGGRYVPMYEAELLHVWKYIVKDSGVKVLFVANPAVYEKVKDFPKDIPTLERIFIIDGAGENTMAAVEKLGAAHPVPSLRPDPDDIAGLIYTSGTTGDPKGVLLSHGNLTSNTLAGIKKYPELNEKARTLAILPWAHSYGQTAELHAVIRMGASMGLAESPATIAGDLALVKPNWLVAVPRVFNRIYDGLLKKMEETGGLAKTLFDMGVAAAKKKRELAAQGKTCMLTNLKFKIADKVVFAKVREKMGGRLMGCMSGSAAMNPDIAQFFFDIGIPIYDCYGMTETSPAIAMNASYAYRLGSVGQAIDKVKIVIDSSVVQEGATDGEIVVYGPNVMKGYHNKPEQTREVMTADGGIRTGDRGRLDQDGYLYITGRIKEQFKLENGKFVFPAAMEEDICLHPYVQNAVVYGENRPYTICLVVPDFVAVEAYAEKNHLPRDMDMLMEREEIRFMIGNGITELLKKKYGGYEIPKKFVFLKENFTLENGLLTQTMKLKRRVVVEKYRALIEAQYGKK